MTLLGRSKPAFDETANYRSWGAFCCGQQGEYIVVPGVMYPGTHPAVALAPHYFCPGDTLDEDLPHALSDIVHPGQIRQVHVGDEAA